MIRSSLIILCMFCQFAAFAQKKTTFTLRPSVGYETNILRSPASSVTNGESLSRSGLWKNAPYASFNFSVVRTISPYHRFKVRSVLKRSFFTQQIGIKSSDAQLRLSHQYSGKKYKNTSEIGVRNLVQSGTNDFRDILGAPLTYKRLTASNKSDFTLSKAWHLVVQPFAEIKLYDRADFDQFSYRDFGARIQGNYRYSYKHKVGIRLLGEFHQRNYFISQQSNQSTQEEESEEGESEEAEGEFEEENEEAGEFDEITQRERKWNYQKIGIEMRFPKKKHVIVTGLDYTLRSDLTENRFGYHQLQWGFGYQLKLKKTKLILNNSIIARLYPNLTATSGGASLKYIYFKPEISIRQQLSKRVDFLITASMKYRFSSLDDPSRRSMRSYLTTQIGAGLIFKIERLDKPKY
ncbi:MAG: hypothetical protein P8P74_18660 [Crocinitomicaceae bacterium]|nr:hypothetical protein [Crocinitomicaceae bacterium]